MGQPLDTILLEDVLTTTTTVNGNYQSDIIDISNREDEFAIQVDYQNGINVDMQFQLAVSADGNTFIPVTDSIHTVNDADGTSLFDVIGTGTSFIRFEVIVNSGSIDLTKIIYRGKRRH